MAVIQILLGGARAQSAREERKGGPTASHPLSLPDTPPQCGNGVDNVVGTLLGTRLSDPLR